MLRITTTDVWAAEIDDEAGGLAEALRAVAGLGANLDCVIARRRPEKPGKGVLFVAPLTGREQLEAAAKAGFHPTLRVATLKVEGTNRAGLGAEMTRVIGDAGVSMRGLSAAVVGRRFVCYIGFDSAEDQAKAEGALQDWNRRRSPGRRLFSARKAVRGEKPVA